MIPPELFRKIRQIEIRTRGLVNDVFGGEYHSAFKGQGIEFSEVRPYQFGDDIRSIDWNVSARSEETYVKVFEEEREQTLMLVVDVSGSESFGSVGKFKREIAAEICAIVAFSAIKNNDKVGLLMFSDEIELFVPPEKGRRHVLRIIRDLFAHETRSAGTDLSVALNHVLRMLRRRSIVLLVSDFFDDGFERPLRLLGRKHDLISVQLVDPGEEALPDVGLLELTDEETGETVVVDTSKRQVREAFSQVAHERLEGLDALFRRSAIDRVVIRSDHNYLDPLISFFRNRNRGR